MSATNGYFLYRFLDYFSYDESKLMSSNALVFPAYRWKSDKKAEKSKEKLTMEKPGNVFCGFACKKQMTWMNKWLSNKSTSGGG